MKHFNFLFVSLFAAIIFTSCDSTSTQQKIQNLNGYWSISKVEKKDGKVVKYRINPSVDFIKVDSTQKGFRIKVTPKSDGSYNTTRNTENFTIKQENDSLRFHYKTDMAKWSETLLSSDKDHFTVKNKEGITYTYERFHGIPKFEEHGQK